MFISGCYRPLGPLHVVNVYFSFSLAQRTSLDSSLFLNFNQMSKLELPGQTVDKISGY